MQKTTDVEDVLVVGGGDAGKLAALIFKQENPSLNIRVIDDSTDPPKEVGKSTFSSITWILHDKLHIDLEDFIQEVNPVWKHSVYFEDWTGTELFTRFDLKNVMEKVDKSLENAHYRYTTGNFTTVNELATYEAKTPFIEGSNKVQYFTNYPYVAYHFNVHKFNTYLRRLMKERGIEIVDERVQTVNTDDEFITSVESDTTTYKADLYIDATGFQRVVGSELPATFSEYDFLLDSALVTQLPITIEDIVPATVVKSLDNGWTWQIDTTDSRDLGYVYASNYTTRSAAEEEFKQEFDIPESTTISKYEFTSGKLNRAWVGNCLVAGDAYGFVEPLQSTSLSTHAIIMQEAADQLTEHSWVMHEGLRSIVNNAADTYWQEIYDFLSVFYRYSSGETEFWQDMRRVGDDEEWSNYIEEYRDGGGFLSSKSKWAEDGLTFKKMFNVHQTDYTLWRLGVPIDIHESNNISISSDTKETVDDETERIRETVDAFLTYSELYSPEYYGEPKYETGQDSSKSGNEFQT